MVVPEACELSENRDGLMTGIASLMVFDELMTDCSDEKITPTMRSLKRK